LSAPFLASGSFSIQNAGVRTLLLLAAGVACTILQAQGEDLERHNLGPVFALVEENDLVLRTDRNYTQGMKVSYMHGDGSMPSFIRSFDEWLPAIGYEERVARVGVHIGQSIFTPGDTSIKELIPADRPYAGWLYLGLTLQRRGMAAGRWPTLESLEMQLGVIGPESLAEDAQTWVHEVRSFDLPQGWDNQIHAEPGVELRYWRGWKLSSESLNQYVDFIPHTAVNLGNVMTSLRAGGMVRAGWNLPDSYGPQTISSLLTTEGGWPRSRSANRWSVYVFTGLEGWLVGHNVFLDGNLYQHSHSVNKELLVGEWTSGLGAGFRYVELGVMHVLRSPEYRGQREQHGYGSFFLKVLF
jgi:hypothetical protein